MSLFYLVLCGFYFRQSSSNILTLSQDGSGVVVQGSQLVYFRHRSNQISSKSDWPHFIRKSALLKCSFGDCNGIMTAARYYSHLVKAHNCPPTGETMKIHRWNFASVEECHDRWTGILSCPFCPFVSRSAARKPSITKNDYNIHLANIHPEVASSAYVL